MTIETCLTPKLIDQYDLNNKIVVVIDVLRATTTIAVLLQRGASLVKPIADENICFQHKKMGYKIAGEREGLLLENFDFGNSPLQFTKINVKNEKFAITTTNGTKCIVLAKHSKTIITAGLVNIKSVAQYLNVQKCPIVLLCSGWKDTINVEDALCAGALIDDLLQYNFTIIDDSGLISHNVWKRNNHDLLKFSKETIHSKRLLSNGISAEDIAYCFGINTHSVVPILIDDVLIRL